MSLIPGDGPPPTGCCLVTEHIKGAWTIRVDCINTADSLTRFAQHQHSSCLLRRKCRSSVRIVKLFQFNRPCTEKRNKAWAKNNGFHIVVDGQRMKYLWVPKIPKVLENKQNSKFSKNRSYPSQSSCFPSRCWSHLAVDWVVSLFLEE